MGRFYLDMEFINVIIIWWIYWKRIPQICKDKLFGTETGAVADGDYK